MRPQLLGHVLRCHICSLSSVQFCQSDSMSSEPVCELSAGVLLLHDNAPVHMSAKSQAAIQQCVFQQLNHPPYSPDLAPSDYILFRVMKKLLRDKRFSSDEEVKEAVTTWFEEQSKDIFSRGIKSLQQKRAKCIELLGDYIEKLKIYFFL